MKRPVTATTSDGITLNALIDGPAGAPWVVFSNSVLTDLSVWDAQVAVLTDSYRMLRYDQRGHGTSEATEGPMNFDGYGRDLIAVMDAAGVDRAVLVGLSMGCPTALAAAAADPERVAAFVAVDGLAKSAAGREAFWTERRETARTEGMEVIAKSTASRWLPEVDSQDSLAVCLRRMIAATPIEGFATATYALSSYDQSAAASALTCPILGIAGEKDGSMPEAVKRQFGGRPGTEISIIPDAGHLPNFQNPDAFNAVLRDFLDARNFSTKEAG